MKRFWLWVPLGAFLVFVLVVAAGLIKPDDSLHRSKMIGRTVPAFSLPAAASTRPGLSRTDFSGKARLVNIFASWCIPCIAETPVLNLIAGQGVIIDGVAIRDKRPDVDGFLARNGNPYRAIGLDVDSSLQLAIGSSGVPETFVVDANGVIRHQHIGVVGEQDVPEILAALKAAM